MSFDTVCCLFGGNGRLETGANQYVSIFAAITLGSRYFVPRKFEKRCLQADPERDAGIGIRRAWAATSGHPTEKVELQLSLPRGCGGACGASVAVRVSREGLRCSVGGVSRFSGSLVRVGEMAGGGSPEEKSVNPRSLDSGGAENRNFEEVLLTWPSIGGAASHRAVPERNAMWPRKLLHPKAFALGRWAKAHMIGIGDCLRQLSAGMEATARVQGRATADALLVPARNCRKRVDMTGEPGNVAEGER